MDEDQRNAPGRRLGTPINRRRSLGLLGVLGIAGAGLADEALAGKKRKKRKHKVRTSPPPTPPTPPAPGPVSYADARCDATGVSSNEVRAAQTFRALRSGQLTSATFYLYDVSAGVTLDVEIWSVDGSGKPNTVLAGATVSPVPETLELMPLTVTFAGPATVAVGLRYALVVTRTSGGATALAQNYGNPCPDGQAFTAPSSTSVAFSPDGSYDFRFETVVTA